MNQLYFEFMQDNGKKEPLLFQDPLVIIVANKIDEVIPCLQNVQEAVNQGYYAAGYLSYEAAPAFESAFHVHNNPNMPLLWFGIFQEPEKDKLTSSSSYYVKDWLPNTNIEKYNQSIDEIKEFIGQGDTYQVNYTIRLHSKFHGNPIAYYQQLASSQSANYSAYLDIGDYSILSASPELFFHLKDGKVTTKPMKGTVGRGSTVDEDQKNRDWLYHSEKNRAENVMIVDLLRNDLGRIAKPGSVQVPELFTIETYPTVFQMTSTVTAEVEKTTTILDLFKGLFPCGSITGAPKISTMNIIHELEDTPREVYCGTIGYITPEKEAIFNVPIRTVVVDNKNGSAQYGVGGGITWDSTKEEEYEEVLTKAKILSNKTEDFSLLESLGLDNGEYIVLEEHLQRLQRAAIFFDYPIDVERIREELDIKAKSHSSGFYKVRLLVDKNGRTTIELKKTSPIKETVKVALSKEPIDKTNPFLYYKTTNRTVYEKQKAANPDVFDVLLWNENEEITEFTLGNVVVELNGELFTPPVECGLLAGTYREALLRDGIIKEHILTIEDVKACSNVWFINSVRKWVEVTFL
ncbi:aminodeoxychorismate synthase component I [Ornithinibacillus halophilus]|uniref:Para-aminobenzoate synthetase / 4-amino-4-deoxychorismate lyase n=1 Tax=Ornithinibacillus halophilus TaxID=930117 RepID=A0A1M5KL31_9BACI|nr:aminodeoxychorismate synthase component I [Ornithinibacillus halophilus]SHG53542.1 para-aminobenzoate synthetase / 4-amino-4-deoxychorismate lyase [Ornithinibacillus halophilus]